MSIGPGTRLGQYEVQDFVGQGAMGLVYRAYHPHLQRTGAVKVMQALAPDPDAVARFRHEAQAIAQMRHPNIVNVYDFGEFDGTPYMIVEYVPGGSLAARLAAGPLDHPTAIRYLRGIGAGLDYAHAHGVVHRDVKPANVLLSAEDSPVLADFGLAKLLQGSSLKSMTGVTTGTPAYMAPEQVTGSQVGPAADRYSLATIAYEMLTGVIPFDGEALMELLYAQVHRYPQPPSVRRPDLGPEVDGVVMRGLAKSPADRWESCSAFVDALAASLSRPSVPVAHTVVMAPPVTAPALAAGSRPVHGPATAVMAPAVPAAAAPPFTPIPPPITYGQASYPAPRTRSRKGTLAVIGASMLVVLLLAVVGGLVLMRQAVTLSLSPATVVPGDSVQITATHVPANQGGQIEISKVARQFAFLADAGGNVDVTVTVPADAAVGDHQVKICWAATCHRQATLHVVGRAAFVTPGFGSPAATANPVTTPASSPVTCPPVAVSLAAMSRSGGFTVTFHCAAAGRWSISVVQQGKPYFVSFEVANGARTFTTPLLKTPDAVAAGIEAHVAACDSAPRCYDSNAVTVGP